MSFCVHTVGFACTEMDEVQYLPLNWVNLERGYIKKRDPKILDLDRSNRPEEAEEKHS